MLYFYNMSSEPKEDNVFRALANHTRRRMLDSLKEEPHTTGMLCDVFPEMDRCTVMQHLNVLEGADLIIAERRGRERWNHINPLPIHAIHERWIGPHAEGAVALLAKIKRDLETSLIH